ncbi:T9SS type A sorting domain-containing protein [Reichenbachiella sp.]|uniref:T9SS type A sorting domain-containing protein n=1 Tax=Reichenbachiella sp. TaxID=2184521 RepID=UPI003B5C52C9
MRKVIVALFLAIWSWNSYAEGSKNLTPSNTGTAAGANTFIGYLVHSSGLVGNFLQADAPAAERTYIRINDGETLYWGLRRISSFGTDQEDLTVVLYENDGTIATSWTLTNDDGSPNRATFNTPQTGVIESYAEATAGPEAVVGVTGYDAQSYTNNTGSDQDFYVGFIQDDGGSTNPATDINEESWYDLWDFSVYDGTEEQPGRMFCQKWGFTSAAGANLLSTDFQMYARVPSTVDGVSAGNYIKEIDLSGLQPFTFALYANSVGSDPGVLGTTNFTELRQSQTTETALLEYDIFLNNPDLELYPTSTLPTVVIADAFFSCSDTGGGQATIYFETNQVGQVAILIDMNGETGYQAGTTDVLVEQEITAEGSYSVLWDGLDGTGVAVASGTQITISGRFTSGPLHIPMWDVEDSPTGLGMTDVRPATSFDLIYWDDSQVFTGADPEVQLSGTNVNTHTWNSGDNDLLNTWSFGYYQINTQILDFVYNCDTDGDGVANHLDDDGDNDGIPDAEEGDVKADADADGIPDYLDTDFAGFVDANGDGVNDNFDYDQDGIPNALDLDSDNDGISDIIEAGLTDADNDGFVDGFADINNNGLNDSFDPNPMFRTDRFADECQTVADPTHNLSFTVTTTDANGDATLTFNLEGDYGVQGGENFTLTGEGAVDLGTYDYTDSDNLDGSDCNVLGFSITIPQANWNTFNDDGIVTITMTTGGGVDAICGANSSCITDMSVTYPISNPGGAVLVIPDSDGDGVHNYADIDSDNDGIVDVIEAGGMAGANGQISGFTDTDGNGRNDSQDIGALSFPDSDGDGALADYLDIDSDNDGIIDNIESQASNAFVTSVAADTNGNGLCDVYDPNNGGTLIVPVDSDGNGSEDYIDTDADGDGVIDLIEGHDADFNGFGDWDGDNNNVLDASDPFGATFNSDTDSDGLWDVFDTDNGGTAAAVQNTDGADFADFQDTDDDNDGSLTSGEDENSNGDWTDDFTQGQGTAVVGTTVPDYLFRGDYDEDGLADANDADSDNDGLLDTDEDGGEAIDPSQDADNDGVPNYRDPDISGSLADATDSNTDGVYDTYDTDLDGIPDFLDGDSDNDGILDAIEANNGAVPNGFNTSTARFNLNDPDNDGLMNYVDNSPAAVGGSSTLNNADSDADGILDVLDIDSDADGITDFYESISGSSAVTFANLDSNGNGIDDGFDPDNGGTLIIPVNTDLQDNPDYLDDDSDQDGVLDIVEGDDLDNDGFGEWDANTNGATDDAGFGSDTDGDGLVDAFDNVVLGAGINGTGSNADRQNTDGIDNLDYRDTDDDNDGDLTEDEDINLNGDFSDDRTDGQGGANIPDYLFYGDFDGDGVPDSLDGDSDNDGIADADEDNGETIDPSGDEDGDGIPNFRDVDDATVTAGLSDTADANGDGVYDVFDTDADGIPDFRDLDSDNDGFPDLFEVGGTDVDNDGLLDNTTDTDGDGVADIIDPDDGGTPLVVVDTDGDGFRDAADLDSDGDGITNLLEAGGTDADGDGKIDNFVDSDGDGLADIIDPDNGGSPLVIPDTDGDGIDDYLDVDSDNDGITDAVENGGADTDGNGKVDGFEIDTDGDGLPDSVDPDNGGTPISDTDTDGDGIPNNKDLDSDNDGYPDILEGGGTDADFDGRVDAMSDANGDGLNDSTESNPYAIQDYDGDGQRNFADMDSDNDGLLDLVENGLTADAGTGQIDGFTDADTDGWNDAQEGMAFTIVDTDGGLFPDAIPDFLDLDADDDGIVDNIEGQTKATYVAPSGNDTDNDGLDDAYDPNNGGTLLSPPNTDGTGAADYLDDDSDGDTVNDRVEGNNAGRGQYADWDANSNATFDDTGFNSDIDEDGILDIFDNYVGTGITQITGSSAAVTDIDLDDIWDFQDSDDDNDGTLTSAEDTDIVDGNPTNDFAQGGFNIPDYLYSNPDSDGDGVADSSDDDIDNDGLANSSEDGGTGVNPGGDNDSDGILNFQDADMDGDGIANVSDSDADGDNVTDTFNLTDANGDGVIDEFDYDLDGIPDMMDRDSDNDGIADVVEFGLADTDEDGALDGAITTDDNNNGMEDSVDELCDGNPIVTPYYAATLFENNGMDDTDNALGAPDGTYAFTNANGEYITVQFGRTIPNGTDVIFNLAIDGNFNFTTSQSTDGTNFTNAVQQSATGLTTPTDYTYTLNADADYIRFQADGGTERQLYHIYYNVTTGPCFGGTPITIPDTDSDGVPNHLDLDSDNDGITDNREAQTTATYVAPIAGDSDTDGILDVYDVDASGAIDPENSDGVDNDDYLDTDADNDGILDMIEGFDASSNGFADWDTDGDNDITDEFGYNVDTDNDGIWDVFDTDNTGFATFSNIDASNQALQNSDGADEADHRDTDDDNDGTLTSAEDTGDGMGGGADGDWTNDFVQNGNPIPDYLFAADNDGDGVLDTVDGDSDNDGIASIDEYPFGVIPLPAGGPDDGSLFDGDLDNDGIYNYLDDDMDGDGDVNSIDADDDGYGNNFTDANGDGVLDEYDQDQDGIINPFDVDSDNDGIYDGIEANNGTAAAGFDTNTGRFTGVDGDGDGVSSDVDQNDGVSNNAQSTTLANEDFDSDSLEDFLDLDSDNDGITDHYESQATFVALSGNDTDGDGLDDAYDNDDGGTSITPTNTDAGGEPDYRDDDSDDDGVDDLIEAYDANANGFGDWDSDNDNDITDETGYNVDTDGDGVWDIYDIYAGRGSDNVVGTSADLQDTDTDGTVDFRDTDDDEDGIDTSLEDANGNNDWTDDKTQGGGAIPDYLYFADFDGDGIADLQDFDNDNDGILNINEYDASLGDAFGDDDGDGLLNYNDPGVDTNADNIDDRYDFDLDGVPNFFDLDSDNDGILDLIEGAELSDGNDDGTIDAFTDGDSDGIHDAIGYTEGTLDNSGGGDGVTSPANSSTIDGNSADLDQTNEFLVIDLGASYGAGTVVAVLARVDAAGVGNNDLEISQHTANTFSDGAYTNDQQFLAVSNTLYQSFTIELNASAQYIGVENLNSTAGSLQIDGVYFNTSTPPDFDGDGQQDFLDLDSDNDGIQSLLEAGGNDANNDGSIDTFGDTDGDGWANILDADNGGIALSPLDTDTDGFQDYVDRDSDNDGIPDIIEAQGTDATNDGETDVLTDSDADGWVDTYDPDNGGTALAVSDTDNDGNYNYRDLDSDNDLMPDAVEANAGIAPAGMDANGQFSSLVDTDGDGYHDDRDGTDGGAAYAYTNSDASGLADYLDIDSDNDGTPDIVENNGTDSDNDGRVDSFVDADDNGIDDGGSAVSGSDQDGDNLLNYQDADSDNDGISDLVEGGGTDATNDGQADDLTDTDGDGWVDTYDFTNGGSALSHSDTDGDGLLNFLDLDADGDGIPDAAEANDGFFPVGTDDHGRFTVGGNDADGDGLADDTDGTPLALTSTDVDGILDYLDTDSDNDGSPDLYEGFDDDEDIGEPVGANDVLRDFEARAAAYETANGDPGQYTTTDTDTDGIPDWLEDGDGDGVLNFADPDNGFFSDADSDGIVDLFDSDANGVEYGGVSGVPDNDGDMTPNQLDTDNTITLPLDFLSFEGQYIEDKILLSWTTANEINVSHFEVERSADGESFNVIGHLDAINIESTINIYSLYDKSPLKGVAYYRLKQVDFDGKYQYSETIRMESELHQFSILYYPNPVDDLLTLDANEEIQYASIQIISISGGVVYQRVYSEINNSRINIDLFGLQTGVYQVLLETPKGTKKFRIIKK